MTQIKAEQEKQEIQDYNDDYTHPSHNQGKKFEIIEQNLLELSAEPASKTAGKTLELSIEEEESKSKELAAAKKQSAKFQEAKAKEDKASAEEAKASAETMKKIADAAKVAQEAQEQADFVKKNIRPDGTLFKMGVRYFPDGEPVAGVNLA